MRYLVQSSRYGGGEYDVWDVRKQNFEATGLSLSEAEELADRKNAANKKETEETIAQVNIPKKDEKK
jgi:hypothetical protein